MLRKYKNEKGFALLETIVLSFILVGLSAVVYSFHTAVKTEKILNTRAQALYLAEEEFAYLLDKREKGELHEGNYDFLGETTELNNVKFNVNADVKKDLNHNILTAKVTVKWNVFQKERELKLERLIVKRF